MLIPQTVYSGTVKATTLCCNNTIWLFISWDFLDQSHYLFIMASYARTLSTMFCHNNNNASAGPGYTCAEQEAQLSPRDRAMRRVNWNLANCQATVQKLLIRQVVTKSMVWSWRFSREAMRDRQCALNHDAIESAAIVSSVINKPTTLSCVYHLSTTTCCGEIF